MTTPQTAEPVRADDVVDYLRSRGVLTGAGLAGVNALGGGVSADVLAVTTADRKVVVKQALSRLKVATLWEADPNRILIEADALNLAATIAPGAVPTVLDVDAARHIMVLEHAPAEFRNWRDDLLACRVDAACATRLGCHLAAWHTATAGRADLADRFGDKSGFVQLRIEPFYSSVARQHPTLGTRLEGLSKQLLDARECLVHGDFSPKNILTDGTREWVLDWEVAHLGAPVFDLAFLITHLIAKALHRPGSVTAYRDATTAFLHAYRRPVESANLAAHVAALLLARIDGASPVGYLDQTARDRGRRIAVAALSADAITLDSLWEML